MRMLQHVFPPKELSAKIRQTLSAWERIPLGSQTVMMIFHTAVWKTSLRIYSDISPLQDFTLIEKIKNDIS